MATAFAVTVAEAEGPVQAAIWVDALRQAGIAANTYERGVGAALGGAVAPGWAVYPIVVSSEDLGPARNVIAEIAGAGALAPYRDRADARAGQRRVLLTVGVILAGGVALALAARVLA
jgi:hypothetical protein